MSDARRLLEDVTGPLPGGEQRRHASDPESRPMITVGAIFDALPQGTVARVMQILNQPDPSAAELTQLLKPHEAALAAIGLIPAYTAYALIYAAMRQRGHG